MGIFLYLQTLITLNKILYSLQSSIILTMLDMQDLKQIHLQAPDSNELNQLLYGINRIRFLQNRNECLKNNINRLIKPQRIISEIEKDYGMDTCESEEQKMNRLLKPRTLEISQIIAENRQKKNNTKQLHIEIKRIKQKYKKQIYRNNLSEEFRKRVLRNRGIRERKMRNQRIEEYKLEKKLKGMERHEKVKQICLSTKLHKNKPHEGKTLSQYENEVAFAQNLKNLLLKKSKAQIKPY